MRYLICTIFLLLFSSHCEAALPKKILVNAEPFGFGPAAAMAQLFPYIQNEFQEISYIGVDHTLDLHRRLPYHKIFEYHSKEEFLSACKEYDIFLTACDFSCAEWAREAGLKIIIYDPLAWYWRQFPTICLDCDLYLVQNFYGVEKRISQIPFKGKVALIPPIVESVFSRKKTNCLLISFGGLSNHYLENELLSKYTYFLTNGIQASIGYQFDPITIATSQTIASSLQPKFNAKTYSPEEMIELQSEAKLSIMTSGLGNLYNAASIKGKTIWLPPANDSQGQQMRLLTSHGIQLPAIDWHHILDREPINYFAPQEEVLSEIASCMEEAIANPIAFDRLVRHLHRLSASDQNDTVYRLIEDFGSHGMQTLSKEILSWAKD